MNAILSHLSAWLPDPLALAGVFPVVGFIVTRLALPGRPVGQFLCNLICFFVFTALLAAAGVNPSQPTEKMDWNLIHGMIRLLKTIWWLSAAWLLSSLFRALFVYRRQAQDTRLLRDLVSALIYIGALLAIVADVFDIPISGLLTASGVIAIVLGLALQSTLGDVFSGIVLNLAKPYRPGDWVILDSGPPGRVIETNWRATKILLESNDLAIIPNSIIAKAKLVNLSEPMKTHGITITVRLDPSVAPSRSCATLETALMNCNRILRVPASTVTVIALDGLALQCAVQFFVATIEDGPDAQNEVYDMIFRHFAAASVRLAPPAGSAAALPSLTAAQATLSMPRRLLDHLAIFAPLSEPERAALTEKMVRHTYAAGEVLVEQGCVAQVLFILTSGIVVALQGHGKDAGEVTRLAPGECFGQAGVLTGGAAIFTIKALTKSIVYEIRKQDIAPILKERPSMAEDLGQILARRAAIGKARLEEIAVPRKKGEHLAVRLAHRVKDLFGLV